MTKIETKVMDTDIVLYELKLLNSFEIRQLYQFLYIQRFQIIKTLFQCNFGIVDYI